MAYKEKVCDTCGTVFVPTSNRQLRCPECARKVKNERRRIHNTEMKYCKCCGNLFIPKKRNQEFCSNICAYDFRHYKENSAVNDTYIKEEQRKLPPTEEYRKEVDFMLKDFGISTLVPEFETIGELNNWKMEVIKSFL